MVRKRFFISLTVCLFCLSWVPLTTGYCRNNFVQHTLYEVIRDQGNGTRRKAFPGLCCGQDSDGVILTLFKTRDAALENHVQGVCRLFEIMFPDDISYNFV